MKMSRKIVSGIITVLAILAMGVMAFAKEPVPVQKQIQQLPQIPTQTTAIINATISGSITMGSQSVGPTTFWNNKNCSDIDVKVTRVTNPYQSNQQTATLLTTKATGGYISSGCSYSVTVKKGPGTVVTASYPISLLPPQPGGPQVISGWQGPFDLNANITKNIVMYMQFF